MINHQTQVYSLLRETIAELSAQHYSAHQQRGSCEERSAMVGGKKVTMAIWKEPQPDGKLWLIVQAYFSTFWCGHLLVDGIEVAPDNLVRHLTEEELDPYW